MTEFTLDELHSIELEILKNVAAFCENNGIRYYLCGGTLLGCIRHNGFIPWDDDIDITMPRPDYIKFIETFNKTDNIYKVKSPKTESKWYGAHARVEDTRTIIDDDLFGYKDEGVFIDVFPIDGAPADERERKHFWFIKNTLMRIYAASQLRFTISHYYADKPVCFSALRTGIRTMVKFLSIPAARLIGHFFNLIQIVEARASKYDVDKTEYIGCSTCPICGYSECIKGKPFLKMKKRLFEGEFFSTPDDYEEYLSNLYGDYMKLPPKNKQVAHHSFAAYWKNKR